MLSSSSYHSQLTAHTSQLTGAQCSSHHKRLQACTTNKNANRMPVHSFHIFDRRGKTLFTKRYAPGDQEDVDRLAEQRQLVFGMLFSLRELSNSLAPSDKTDLQMVQTGASTLYNYETGSGLRFCLYMSPAKKTSDEAAQAPLTTARVRQCLQHVFEHIWVLFVVRSPLYQPSNPDVSKTHFEASLDHYLKSMPFFR